MRRRTLPVMEARVDRVVKDYRNGWKDVRVIVNKVHYIAFVGPSGVHTIRTESGLRQVYENDSHHAPIVAALSHQDRNRSGRGIDDDDGPRGSGPRKSMTWGVMPPRAEFRKHFDYYVGTGGYRIVNDPAVGTATYSEAELFALIKRFGGMLGSARKGAEEKASLASAVMETLGFEWI